MAKILIVDDDPLFIALIEELLSEDNRHSILTENNGYHIPAILEAEKPDLLITDLVMPDREGLEIVISTREQYPDLPIIAVSGVAKDYLSMAKDMGANDVIEKPINPDSFLNMVNQYFS